MRQELLSLNLSGDRTSLETYHQDPLGFMTRCAHEGGDLVPLQLGDDVCCLLTHPDLITEVLKDRLLFIKAKDLQMLQGLLGKGLLTSEGDFWQRQRRLTQPVFHQHRIHDYGAVMVDYTRRMLDTWQDGDVRNVHDEMMRLTLNIVMKTLFNRDVTDAEASHIAQALEETMNWADARAIAITANNDQVTAADRRYHRAIALLDETVYAMIHQRRSSGTLGEDLLGLLMQVEDADDGSRMSDAQLRDEVATLMLAGHETTANTLAWTWMLLATHPHVSAKLTAELNAVLHGRTPTVADLPQLPYAHQIIKESMRLYPPITEVTREATQDCDIGGHTIPKGTIVIASQWVMHRNPRYFPAPEVFCPERWENDMEKRLPRGVYFPFGDGPRICIGKSFALMEAVLLLATIVQTFRLDLIADQTIELQPSITLRPRYGIQVSLKTV